MAEEAYLLLQAELGQAGSVTRYVLEIPGVTQAETIISGPYDVIAFTRVDDVDTLGKLVKRIQVTAGVTRTLTCRIYPGEKSTEEHLVRVSGRQARLLYGVLLAVLADFGISAEDPRISEVILTRLREVTGESPVSNATADEFAQRTADTEAAYHRAITDADANWGGPRCVECGLPVVRGIISNPDHGRAMVHADRAAVPYPHNVVLSGDLAP